MNNEFGDDLSSNSTKNKGNFSGNENSRSNGKISFTGGTGIELNRQSKILQEMTKKSRKLDNDAVCYVREYIECGSVINFRRCHNQRERMWCRKRRFALSSFELAIMHGLVKRSIFGSDSGAWKGTSHIVTPRALIYREGKRANKALIDVSCGRELVRACF